MGFPGGRRGVDALLADARERILRLSPAEAFAAAESGALIVDIRCEFACERDGVIPGSLHVPRTVLEWRLDPESAWKNPYVGGLEREIVVVCDHGYSSSLAAAVLVELGFERAADVVGGFEAWRESGLPVIRYEASRDGETLAGMRPPIPR